MAKKIIDMDYREIEKVISRALGGTIADFNLGGNLRKLSMVISQLIDKAHEEGIAQGSKLPGQ